MTKLHPMIVKIQACTDIKLLKNWRANGLRTGDSAIAHAAIRQLAGLGATGEPGSLLHDFWQTIVSFEVVMSEKNGKNTRLTKVRQRLAKNGVVAALAEFAASTQPEGGFEILTDTGLTDLTGEAAIVRHAGDFPLMVVDAANARLLAAAA